MGRRSAPEPARYPALRLAGCRPLEVPRWRSALLRGGELLDFQGYFTDGFLNPLAPCDELSDCNLYPRRRQKRLPTFVRPDQLVNTLAQGFIQGFHTRLSWLTTMIEAQRGGRIVRPDASRSALGLVWGTAFRNRSRVPCAGRWCTQPRGEWARCRSAGS